MVIKRNDVDYHDIVYLQWERTFLARSSPYDWNFFRTRQWPYIYNNIRAIAAILTQIFTRPRFIRTRTRVVIYMYSNTRTHTTCIMYIWCRSCVNTSYMCKSSVRFSRRRNPVMEYIRLCTSHYTAVVVVVCGGRGVWKCTLRGQRKYMLFEHSIICKILTEDNVCADNIPLPARTVSSRALLNAVCQ